jgi:hypothetical protein
MVPYKQLLERLRNIAKLSVGIPAEIRNEYFTTVTT